MMEKLLILFFYIKTKYFSSFKSRIELEKYQKKKINEIIKYITAKSPFYKKVYTGKQFLLSGDASGDAAVINKKIMMDNFDDFNTAKIKLKEALFTAQKAEDERDFTPMINSYSVGLSSGTSGNRGVFIISPAERAAWCGTILAKMMPHSIFKKTKIAFFLRANNTLYESVNSLTLKFQFFDLKNEIGANISELNNFKPDILVAPPAVLSLIANAIDKKQIDINPLKVISAADVLYDDIKQKLEKTFKQTIHQIYQATEGFLACTCPCGELHINEDLIYIHKKYIDKDNGRFIPIITDFCRKTQPIIKYELNDILLEDNTPCPCGSIFARISAIEGRCDDILRFKDTNAEEVVIFPDFIIRAILKAVPAIENFKVVQASDNTIEMFLPDGFVEAYRIEEVLSDMFAAKRLDIKIIFKELIIEKNLSIKRKRVEKAC